MRSFPVSAACALLISSQALAGEWNNWLASQIHQHPDVVAAKERWQGANAEADAMNQPLYNPALSVGADRNGDENNYSVGLEHTIDLWDKRAVNTQQTVHLKTAAKHMYKQQVLDKTAEVIIALVEWQSAQQAADVAKVQQDQLNKMLELVDVRKKSGDLGAVDAELTFLSLSQQITQVAETESSLLQAETRLRELLPKWAQSKGGIPNTFWPKTLPTVSDDGLRLYPRVAKTEAEWRSLKESTELARRAAKADPTLGVNAGRDGGDSLIGLSVSIPLHVRNDFSAEVRAAQSLELEAEALWMAAFRKQRVDWDAARVSWQRYEYYLEKWQALLANRVENSQKLLERQWQSGDLPTPDYLLALNQRAESLLAGVELNKKTQLALTEALYQSGHLATLIKPLN